MWKQKSLGLRWSWVERWWREVTCSNRWALCYNWRFWSEIYLFVMLAFCVLTRLFICVSGAQGEELEGEIVCSEGRALFPALLWPQQGEKNADVQFYRLSSTFMLNSKEIMWCFFFVMTCLLPNGHLSQDDITPVGGISLRGCLVSALDDNGVPSGESDFDDCLFLLSWLPRCDDCLFPQINIYKIITHILIRIKERLCHWLKILVNNDLGLVVLVAVIFTGIYCKHRN